MRTRRGLGEWIRIRSRSGIEIETEIEPRVGRLGGVLIWWK